MATTPCEYTSDNPDVNQVESIYREAVGNILYEFCMELSEEQAKQGLTEVIQVLTSYLEK